MKRILIIIAPLFFIFITGCQIVEHLVDANEAVTNVGEGLAEVGVGTSAFNPAVGLAILGASGVLVIVGKVLKTISKEI